jgi:hypothetical protein
MKLLKKIKTWWRWNGKYYHKDFAHGVRNLWRWFPTIWKDRNWDGNFIYSILAKKLEFQAKYIGDNDRHTSAKRDAEVMRLVVKLIQLQKEDFYDIEFMDYHETEYHFTPTDETKKWYSMNDTLISERFDDYFKKYPRQYKRVLTGEINRYDRPIEEKDKKLIAMEIAHENHERARELIFNIINHNIERWWD